MHPIQEKGLVLTSLGKITREFDLLDEDGSTLLATGDHVACAAALAKHLEEHHGETKS